MELNLIPSVDMIRINDMEGKAVVIIDVLRATSVITTALANGADAVLPVVEVKDALLKKANGILLGGERKAMKIEGFDLSNSPLEYERSIVEGKTIVLSTTNGTKAIHQATDTGAISIVAGCMLNAKAVAEFLTTQCNNIAILCAGTYGNFSLDDYICAGKIIYECMQQNDSIKLDDFSKASLMAYEANKDSVLAYVSHANHYKYLMSIGLERDIEYCFMEDLFKVVPKLRVQNGASDFVIA